jgi:hypothetical protein
MRRIAWGTLALIAGALAGCGTINSGSGMTHQIPGVPARQGGASTSMSAATSDDFAVSAGSRFSREAVPDSVMLRDQIGSGYRDSTVP